MNNLERYRSKDGRFYYLYKITTDFDKSYYYGKHVTNNLDDGYMGSGSYLLKIQNKVGIQHFHKHIIKFFDNNQDLLKSESLLVTNDLLKDPLCMNISPGGGWDYTNWIIAKDKSGNVKIVSKDDPLWLNGELVGITKGYGVYKDLQGTVVQTLINDPRVLSGELVGVTKGDNHMPAYDVKYKKNIRVLKTDPRWSTGEIISHTLKQVTVKDSFGNTFNVSTQEYFDNPDLKQVTKGTVWVNNGKCNKRIQPKEISVFMMNGWKKGKLENCVWMYNEDVVRKIKSSEVNTYIKMGWIKGRPYNWKTHKNTSIT